MIALSPAWPIGRLEREDSRICAQSRHTPAPTDRSWRAPVTDRESPSGSTGPGRTHRLGVCFGRRTVMPAPVRGAAAHVERRVQTAQGRTRGVQRDLGGGSPRCARENARCAHFLTENIARTFFSRLSFRWSAKICPIREQSVIPCESCRVGQSRERVQLALRPRSA